jgi:hypothetical protein
VDSTLATARAIITTIMIADYHNLLLQLILLLGAAAALCSISTRVSKVLNIDRLLLLLRQSFLIRVSLDQFEHNCAHLAFVLVRLLHVGIGFYQGI